MGAGNRVSPARRLHPSISMSNGPPIWVIASTNATKAGKSGGGQANREQKGLDSRGADHAINDA
jgi:hypothetical protein